MTGWHEGPLCGFDIESTGTDPETARIVTAAIVASGPGGASESAAIQRWLVDPGCEIPDGATDVHGITTEKARSEGRDAASAVPLIVTALFALARAMPLVIYNAPYDLTVLDREMRRYGTWYQPAEMPCVIDPLVLDKHLDRYRRGSRKLADTCRHYGVRLDDAHDAAADTLAAVALARKLALRYPEIAVMTPLELHELQVKAKADQAASFQEHLRRKGSSEVIDGSWPLKPWTDHYLPGGAR